MATRTLTHSGALVLSTLILGACAAASPATSDPVAPVRATPPPATEADQAKFERDRESILAMAGDYDVTFDFTETVSFVDGYEVKEPKVSGAHESVRVVEDRGDFISLQHLLVAGPPHAPMVIKHWRQDWHYEPEGVLKFIGGNAWAWHELPESERAGAWSQTVYQVDDSPRYGAVAVWSYQNGLAEWSPPREWRPLPRRDMTTRDDYHAVDAVNRHVLTPDGWVHEQDNSKVVLDDHPHVLVREVGVNTYDRFDDYPTHAADAYWSATADYWAGVRAEWNEIIAEHAQFAIMLQGETAELYMPLLGLASSVESGENSTSEAVAEARRLIGSFVSPHIAELGDRLRPRATDPAGRD
ncbi:MAG: DUF6607 family protein [Gemmatimonadota bacterium]